MVYIGCALHPLLCWLLTSVDGLARSLGYARAAHYAVVVDAGSSGTRVLAFKFRVPFTVFGDGGLELAEEYFHQTKPGLSSYSDEPEKGAATVAQLVESAAHMVPAAQRATAPLVVRATAGLRLLPAERAAQLMQQVRISISSLGYSVASDAVEVMEGSDEGIFIWYTVNLLHNSLGERDSMAALDLGGGSTQITYRVGARDAGAVPPADLFHVRHGGHNVSVFTHSYLHLGLLAARSGILRLEAGAGNAHNFSSVCVDPIVTGEPWTYANEQYYVSGAARPPALSKTQVVERCHALVRKYIMKTLDWEPQRPPRGDVAAMSYFYDIAADAGIIDVMKGGAVKISRYLGEATEACSGSNVEQPWACLDLVYVYSLLHDAYKMPPDHTVSLFKKVDGHEVSWALGLAYTTILDMINVKTAR